MLRIATAVVSGLSSALCVLVVVATVVVVSQEVRQDRDVPWLEVLPVVGLAVAGAIGLGLLAWKNARRARTRPPPRHVWIPVVLGGAAAMIVLGAAIVTAPAVGLLRSGHRTVGTVVAVASPDLGSSEGRPAVQFEHVDGQPRSFRASNPFGVAYREGDPVDVVYDRRACTIHRCDGFGIAQGVAALRLQIVLGIAVTVFFVAAPVVAAVVLRRRATMPDQAPR